MLRANKYFEARTSNAVFCVTTPATNRTSPPFFGLKVNSKGFFWESAQYCLHSILGRHIQTDFWDLNPIFPISRCYTIIVIRLEILLRVRTAKNIV